MERISQISINDNIGHVTLRLVEKDGHRANRFRIDAVTYIGGVEVGTDRIVSGYEAESTQKCFELLTEGEGWDTAMAVLKDAPVQG